MVAFLGVPADKRLLDEDRLNLPETEQYQESAISTHQHNRLVAAGSVLTGVTLVGGAALTLFGGVAVAVQRRWSVRRRPRGDWNPAGGHTLGVGTRRRIRRPAHRCPPATCDRRTGARLAGEHSALPAVQCLDECARRCLDACHTCTASAGADRAAHVYVCSYYLREETFDADASAEVIATTVETMRHQARLETDRLSELWDAASGAYTAALSSAHDDQQELAAQRAAATALSEHINASLLQPPLVE